MISFDTEVRIQRPIEEVFSYISDPLNFPRWNSAVRTVRKSSASEGGVGAIYVMERDLPTGGAVNELEVTASAPHSGFAIRTNSGPTPFVYVYRFLEVNGSTVVTLHAEVELPGPAALLRPTARRVVKKGIDENFATLKQIIHANNR